jgi:hypothetical protein
MRFSVGNGSMDANRQPEPFDTSADGSECGKSKLIFNGSLDKRLYSDTPLQFASGGKTKASECWWQKSADGILRIKTNRRCRNSFCRCSAIIKTGRWALIHSGWII